MRKHLIYALAVVIYAGTGAPAFATNILPGWNHYFKEGAQLHDESFALAGAARPVEYLSTEACPTPHKTSQNRNYTHLHLNHGFPQVVVINFVNVNITAAKIGLFWDDEYVGYDGIPAAHDMSHNCHGHAFKSNTVISPDADGLGRWNADYVWTAGAGSDNGLDGWCAESYTGHAIRSKYKMLTCTIASVQTPVNKIICTTEKYRDSGIYSKSGGDCDTTIGLKAKFNFDNSAMGPYTTHNDCKMCHNP